MNSVFALRALTAQNLLQMLNHARRAAARNAVIHADPSEGMTTKNLRSFLTVAIGNRGEHQLLGAKLNTS